MKRIRVLVVEDSWTVRRRLVSALAADPGIEVVGEAGDGKHAIELCDRLRPDVVTLDMMIPNGTGLDVTEHIMAYVPTPIVIVSASVNRGALLHTYDALAAGALDVLDKPRGDEPQGEWDTKFINTVKTASRIKVVTHPRGRRRTPVPGTEHSPRVTHPRPPEYGSPPDGGRYSLIAMGASTGGPGAISEILRALKPPIPLPILLVIHIGSPFDIGLTKWLGQTLPLPVFEGKHGDPLPPPGTGCLIVAPPDRHLAISNGHISIENSPERHACRPSVDVLFESIATEIGPRAIGCLLTGMGRDGAAGLLAMKNAGAMTLVQDESTSVVFGMPREAIRLGAAKRILPLPKFSATLLALASQAATND